MKIFLACLLGLVIGVGIIGFYDGALGRGHGPSGIAMLVSGGLFAAGGGLIAAGVIQ
jgi:hypothetical protein